MKKMKMGEKENGNDCEDGKFVCMQRRRRKVKKNEKQRIINEKLIWIVKMGDKLNGNN